MLIVFGNLLSIVVLIVFVLSIIISIFYTVSFIYTPYQDETVAETDPLLSSGPSSYSTQAKLPSDSTEHDLLLSYTQMIALAVAYALVIAIRFNSIKAMLQLSWASGHDESSEVFVIL
jgi:hypothetical protein